MRLEALDPQRQALSFDDFLVLRYGAPREELRTSRYRRGLFALRKRMAAGITEDDVRAAWVRGSQTEYGPSIVVTELLLSFQIPKAVVESTPRRSREEALRIAQDVLRRIRGGGPAGAVRVVSFSAWASRPASVSAAAAAARAAATGSAGGP